MAGLRTPVSTYRVQFNASFRFQDARALVPYLHRPGITDLYCSPIFQARRGSTHSYDVTDYSLLNAELGTEEGFDALVTELKANGMGLLLDIVPNHMAASPENPWWTDLLENGPGSQYGSYFDVDWSIGENKLILPFLGSPYQLAIQDGAFRLALDELGFSLYYYELRLPVEVRSYALILSHRLGHLESTLGDHHSGLIQLKELLEAVHQLPPYDGLKGYQASRFQQAGEIKQELQSMVNSSPDVAAFLSENIALFNGKGGDAKGFELIDRLLAQQPYKLVFWKTGREKINYRRFFDINDLVGVRVEDPSVFEATPSAADQPAAGGSGLYSGESV
ncbi:MAG: alpha-amylase family glycosyl hydrolase [Chloroflexi bacterium]|nr:alpha-amylase family glycosyl hydrolase [Chloroflexota bacterium]